jgi:trigger factor
MQATKKELEKSQVEINVELSVEKFAPYIEKGALKVSQEVKIEGFRPGKVPYDVLKQKIGEMTILEEAANLAIRKTIDEAIEKNTVGVQAFGQPQVNITKLAPGNPLEYKIILSLLPTIALGKYKGLDLKVEEAEVSDKEVAKALEDLQEMRAKEALVEGEVKENNKVTASVHLFLDKVPLEDGHHHDIAIMMGKDYFVPGFDKQLLGMKSGETRKFSLPYPDDHYQKNLAGKMVEFEVEVKAVYTRELPEINDEFASFFQMKNIEELKKNIKESLLHEKKHQVDMRNESALLTKIIDDTKFGDFAEALVDSESRNMLMELEQSVVRQGGKFEDYLSHLKKTKDQLILELMPNAIKRVKSALVIRELAIVEKINPTEKDIEEKISELKKQYAGNAEVTKMIAEPGYAHYLQNVLTNEKVLEKLKDWNYAATGSKQES